MNPRISICIPAYRQANRLAVLFQSIERQTYRDFEVVVTDDSPDSEVEDLCRQTTSFPLRYFRNPEPLGSPENWNCAISKARGIWVKLIHHDDYFYSPEALQEFLNTIDSRPDADYVYCSTHILDSNTGNDYPYLVNPQHKELIAQFPAYLFHKNLIGAPSTGFFKRSLALRYDPKLIWLVDIEYYCRLVKDFRLVHVDALLVTTVISENQLTTGLKNNKPVELGEFFYCYSKLMNGFDSINRKIMRYRMLNLLKEYAIHSVSELQTSGLTSPVPTYTRLFLIFARIDRKLAFRIFYKLNDFRMFQS